MSAQKIIAAALLIGAGSAFAADAPATAGAAHAAAAVAATAASTATVASISVSEAKLNLPALNTASVRDRDAVRAEAIEAMKTRKTTLAEQLDQYK